MIIEFECVSVAKNQAPPGRPVTYNATYQAVQDSDVNREAFGGSIAAMIQIGGIKKLPHGMDQRVKIDIGGVPESAAAVPSAAPAGTRRTFGTTQEVK
jgi:hypothetical protein